MAKRIDRVRERFYWNGMKKDVHEVVSMLSKKWARQKHISNLTTWKTSHPLWQVVLDITGHLPESRGNKFILLVGDQFTQLSKRYDAISKSNQEASTAAEAFVNVLVSRFGCLANLHSDKGNNFMSNLFTNMCKELGINRTSTTAYHPQGNAMIERTNRTKQTKIYPTLSDYVESLKGEQKNPAVKAWKPWMGSKKDKKFALTVAHSDHNMK